MNTDSKIVECVHFKKIVLNKHNDESDSGISSGHCQVDVIKPIKKAYRFQLPVLTEASSENSFSNKGNARENCFAKICSKTLTSALIKTNINSEEHSIVEFDHACEGQSLHTNSDLGVYSVYYNTVTNNNNIDRHFCDLDIAYNTISYTSDMSNCLLNDNKLNNFISKIKGKLSTDTLNNDCNSLINDSLNSKEANELVFFPNHNSEHHRADSKKRRNNAEKSHGDLKKRKHRKHKSKEQDKSLPITNMQNKQEVYYVVMDKKHQLKVKKKTAEEMLMQSQEDLPEKDLNNNVMENQIINAINQKFITTKNNVSNETLKKEILENALKNENFRKCVLDSSVSIEVMNQHKLDKITSKRKNSKSFENLLENSSKISKEPDSSDLRSVFKYKNYFNDEKHRTKSKENHTKERRSRRNSESQEHRKKHKRKEKSKDYCSRSQHRSSSKPDSHNKKVKPFEENLRNPEKHHKNPEKENIPKIKQELKHRKKNHRHRSPSQDKRPKSKYRNEISFTELNLTPVLDFYKSSQQASPEYDSSRLASKLNLNRKRNSSSNSFNDINERKFKRSSSKSSSSRKYDKFKKKCRNFRSDKRSSASEVVTRKERNKHKLQHHLLCNYFDQAHLKKSVFSKKKVISTDRLLEISTKALGEDGSTALGFTVEGIEPPKRLSPKLKPSDSDSSKHELILSKLHFTFFPVVEVKPNAVILSRPVSGLDLVKRSEVIISNRKSSNDRDKHREKSKEREALKENKEDAFYNKKNVDNATCESSSNSDHKKKAKNVVKYSMQKRTKPKELRAEKIDILYDKKCGKLLIKDSEKQIKSKKKKYYKIITEKEIESDSASKLNKPTIAATCIPKSLQKKHLIPKITSFIKSDKNASNLEIINEESQSHYSSTDTDKRTKMNLANMKLTTKSIVNICGDPNACNIKIKEEAPTPTPTKHENISREVEPKNVSCKPTENCDVPKVELNKTKRRLPSQIPKLATNRKLLKLNKSHLDELYRILCATQKDHAPNLEESLDKLIKYLSSSKEDSSSLSQSPRGKAKSKIPDNSKRKKSNEFSSTSSSSLQRESSSQPTINNAPSKFGTTVPSDGRSMNKLQRSKEYAEKIRRMRHKKESNDSIFSQSNVDINQNYNTSTTTYESTSTMQYASVVSEFLTTETKKEEEEEVKPETQINTIVYKANLEKCVCGVRKDKPSCSQCTDGGKSCKSLVCCMCKKMLNCCDNKTVLVDDSLHLLPAPTKKQEQVIQANVALTSNAPTPFKTPSLTTICTQFSVNSVSANSSSSTMERKKISNSNKPTSINDSTSEETIEAKRKLKRNRFTKKKGSLSKALSVTEVTRTENDGDNTKHQPFLVMSTTSSCTVCSSPSEFLTRVENQLKKDKCIIHNKAWGEVVNTNISRADIRYRLFTHDSFSRIGNNTLDDDFMTFPKLHSSELLLKPWRFILSPSSKQLILSTVNITEQALNTILNILESETSNFYARNKFIRNNRFRTRSKRAIATINRMFLSNMHESNKQNNLEMGDNNNNYNNSFFLHPVVERSCKKFNQPQTSTDEIDFSVDSLESNKRKDSVLIRRKYGKPRSCMTFQKPAPNTYFVYNTTIETNSPFTQTKEEIIQETIIPDTSTQLNLTVTSEESGYESNKTKKNSLKALFTKGGLLDLFKLKRKGRKKSDEDISVSQKADTDLSTDFDQNETKKAAVQLIPTSSKKKLSNWANVGKKLYKFSNESDKIYSYKLEDQTPSATNIKNEDIPEAKTYTINLKNQYLCFSEMTSDTDQSQNKSKDNNNYISDSLDESTNTDNCERRLKGKAKCKCKPVCNDIAIEANDGLDVEIQGKEEDLLNCTLIDKPKSVRPKTYTISFNKSKTKIKSFADIAMKQLKLRNNIKEQVNHTNCLQNMDLKTIFLRKDEDLNTLDSALNIESMENLELTPVEEKSLSKEEPVEKQNDMAQEENAPTNAISVDEKEKEEYNSSGDAAPVENPIDKSSTRQFKTKPNQNITIKIISKIPIKAKQIGTNTKQMGAININELENYECPIPIQPKINETPVEPSINSKDITKTPLTKKHSCLNSHNIVPTTSNESEISHDDFETGKLSPSTSEEIEETNYSENSSSVDSTIACQDSCQESETASKNSKGNETSNGVQQCDTEMRVETNSLENTEKSNGNEILNADVSFETNKYLLKCKDCICKIQQILEKETKCLNEMCLNDPFKFVLDVNCIFIDKPTGKSVGNENNKLKVKLAQALNILNSKEHFSVTSLDVQYLKNLIENKKCDYSNEEINVNKHSMFFDKTQKLDECSSTSDVENVYDELLKILQYNNKEDVLNHQPFPPPLLNVYNISEEKAKCSEFCNFEPCLKGTVKEQTKQPVKVKNKKTCCMKIGNKKKRSDSIEKQKPRTEFPEIPEVKERYVQTTENPIEDTAIRKSAELTETIQDNESQKSITEPNKSANSSTIFAKSSNSEIALQEKVDKINIIESEDNIGKPAEEPLEEVIYKFLTSEEVAHLPRKHLYVGLKGTNEEVETEMEHTVRKHKGKIQNEELPKTSQPETDFINKSKDDKELNQTKFKPIQQNEDEKGNESQENKQLEYGEQKPKSANETDSNNGSYIVVEAQSKENQPSTGNKDKEGYESSQPTVESQENKLLEQIEGEQNPNISNESDLNNESYISIESESMENEASINKQYKENYELSHAIVEPLSESEEFEQLEQVNGYIPSKTESKENQPSTEATYDDEAEEYRESTISNSDSVTLLRIKRITKSAENAANIEDANAQTDSKINKTSWDTKLNEILDNKFKTTYCQCNISSRKKRNTECQCNSKNTYTIGKLLKPKFSQISENLVQAKHLFSNYADGNVKSEANEIFGRIDLKKPVKKQSTTVYCQCNLINAIKKDQECQCKPEKENRIGTEITDTLHGTKVEISKNHPHKMINEKNVTTTKTNYSVPEIPTNTKKTFNLFQQNCVDKNCKTLGKKMVNAHCQSDYQQSKIKSITKSCNCEALRFYTQQVKECHAYAEKVRLESELRKEGYLKQYVDFKEIPLHILLGRAPPARSPRRQMITKNVSLDIPSDFLIPKSKAGNSNLFNEKVPHLESAADSLVRFETLNEQIKEAKQGDTNPELEEYTENLDELNISEKPQMTPKDSLLKTPKAASYEDIMSSKNIMTFEVPMDKETGKRTSFIQATETIKLRPSKKTDAELKKLLDEDTNQILSTESGVDLRTGRVQIERISPTESKTKSQNKKKRDSAGSNSIEEVRQSLTDKEIFTKLLDTYEKEDDWAEKLSYDEEFFTSQLTTVKTRGSATKFLDDPDAKKTFYSTKHKDLVEPQDIGACFARGFRPDNVTLTGDACINTSSQDKKRLNRKTDESIIDFSERDTPLDYLLGLGFMVDEATNALKDEDVEHRLLAAITEARVWINQITTTQGTLLYLVAYKAKPKIMRYFLQLVEAVINRRITNAVKLDGFLRVLDKIEQGEIGMLRLFNERQFEDEENEERIVKSQLRQIFMMVYKAAENEAHTRGRILSKEAVMLLRILAAKYRAGLNPHLELIAKYIGIGTLHTEVQLEAAMIFLSRLDTAEVKIKEFEKYCNLTE